MFTPSVSQVQKIAEAIRINYPDVVAKSNGRLEAGYLLASTPGAVVYQDIGLPYLVQSARDPSKFYETSKGLCTCPDHKKRAEEGIVCKHRFAIYVWNTAWHIYYHAEKPVKVVPQVGDLGEVDVFSGYGFHTTRVKLVSKYIDSYGQELYSTDPFDVDNAIRFGWLNGANHDTMICKPSYFHLVKQGANNA